MNLVIVESPTKAKTISKFLGPDYKVMSSMGHIRDLPKSEMGVDIEHNFEPRYIIPPKSKKTIGELKKAAEKSDYILFATDEDREGEAISWHLVQILKTPEDKIRRIVFHEITDSAIKEALNHPRDIDMNLVDAQQARRVLDRLVGYELSPFLWKKVARGLSAGRVQSVAVRLIVEREREIQAFKKQEYWSIMAALSKKEPRTKNQEPNKDRFEAKLYKVDGNVLDKLAIKNKQEADKILNDLKGAQYQVAEIKKKEIGRKPLAPFTTSSLQQEANKKLGFSAKQTMMFAQQLYEGVELGEEGSVGLITYMRTDSVNLADKFLGETRQMISASFGDHYLPASPQRYKTKSKLAQEAHEAIRPTSALRKPEEVKPYLDDRQFKLYNLIWRRAIASQMGEAIIDATTVDVEAKQYIFRATGSTIKFDGFMKIYNSGAKEIILPPLKEKEELDLIKLEPKQHFTEPPPRYSDATLVKTLEEHGIGRPSTYAPTIGTIIARKYVERDEKKKLFPSEIAFLVNDLLVEHFPKIVDFKFTARLEDDLDEIAQGKSEWVPIIKEFYNPFKQNLNMKDKEISKKELTEEKTEEKCDKCGKPMVIKLGRFGKFLACTGFPECRNTKPLNDNGEKAEPEITNEKCDKCGAPMVQRRGKYGPFLGCSKYPECKGIKRVNKTTGVKCPECGRGEIAERRSKKGRTFFSCDRYPDCKYATWERPKLDN